MVGWLFLSFGLVLGMLWAYEELGWGGYWGWDPVENAGLLPWFTATAFLHSVMVQERRGMLRVWNMTLVITTFFLTIFGTFMTRSGIVQSVHAFGEDRELAFLFTIFMVLILTVSFGLLIYRLPLLRARHDLDSWVSREAAFLANNWILLFSAFFVLFATMFPTISEALRGERLTVGPPFFNKWMMPIGLILLVLTGIAPLLAWRKTTLSNLVHQFMWPVVIGLGTGVALWALGMRVWSAGNRLRAVRLRRRDHRAGVHPRRAGPPRRHRLGHRHGDDRPGRPLAPPLRRLHRPSRHRADVSGLRRRGVQEGRAGRDGARASR
jgi:cytochrome c-type biogenesis protein CcmF